MKKLFNFIVAIAVIFNLGALTYHVVDAHNDQVAAYELSHPDYNYSFVQENAVEKDEPTTVVETISYILNAILGVVLYFINNGREKAEKTVSNVESKVKEVTTVAKEKLSSIENMLTDLKADFNADGQVSPDTITKILNAVIGLTKWKD